MAMLWEAGGGTSVPGGTGLASEMAYAMPDGGRQGRRTPGEEGKREVVG